MLVSACEGGTGSTSHGAGRGDRATLSCIRADLEHAADQLPLHWATTAKIFKIQQRWKIYIARCAQAGHRGGEIEQPVGVCCERMARTLGWTPEQEKAA